MSLVERIVQVVFKGKNEVTEPANQATGAVEGFSSKVGGLLKGLAALAAGLALGEFFKKAVEEATISREVMGQLALAVENTGASFGKMSPEIDATLNKLATMTKFGDDDFARAMQQMTLKTGDADWALKNLGQAADLAAAGNIDLEQASTMLAMAHEGNTKALFKMMPELKGAANWQELLAQKTAGAAEAQMRQLGPLAAIDKQFGEVAESVGKAILGNGAFEESGFGVATMLSDVAGWIEANSGELGKFVDVLIETGKNIVESLTPSFQVLMRIAGPALKVLAGLIAEAGFAIRAWSIFAEESAGKVIQAIGWIVEKGAKVLKVFGIEVGDGLAETITKFGQKLDTEASARWTKMTADHTAFWQRMKKGGDESVDVVAGQEKKKTQIVKTEIEDQDKALKAALEAQKQRWKLVDDAAVSYRKVIETLKPAIEKNVTLREIDAQSTALDGARANADALIKKMQEHGNLPPLIKKTESAIGAVGEKLNAAAGYALDVAGEIGGIDDEAKALLESCQSVGEVVANIAKGGLTFAGVTGLIGGVASIVSTMMAGDKERRDLTRQHIAAMTRLSVEGVQLSTKASGSQIAGVASALTNDQLQMLAHMGQGNGAIGDMQRRQGNQLLTEILSQSGIRLSDLDTVASELGFNLRRSNGEIELSLLPSFFAALKQSVGGLTRIGQSFQEQWAFFQESQRLTGASGTGQVQGALDFLTANGARALQGIDLSDPRKARQQLLDMFVGLNNNTLAPGDIGRLTGEEFRTILTQLIGLLDGLTDTTATASTPASQVDVPGLGTVDVTSGAAESVQDLLREQTTLFAEVMTVHTTLHTRVADNTDAIVKELTLHTVILRDIHTATSGMPERLNQQLEAARQVAMANAGRGLTV